MQSTNFKCKSMVADYSKDSFIRNIRKIALQKKKKTDDSSFWAVNVSDVFEAIEIKRVYWT